MIEVRRTFDPERRSKGILRTPNSALDAMLRIFTPAFSPPTSNRSANRQAELPGVSERGED